MEEKNSKNSALIDFMKKQSTKKNEITQKEKYSFEKTRYEKKEEEDKEKLSEDLKKAKNESNAKLQNRDNSAMIIRLIIESSTKYVLMILILIGIAFLAVEAVPAALSFLHGLFSKVLFSDIKAR